MNLFHMQYCDLMMKFHCFTSSILIRYLRNIACITHRRVNTHQIDHQQVSTITFGYLFFAFYFSPVVVVVIVVAIGCFIECIEWLKKRPRERGPVGEEQISCSQQTLAYVTLKCSHFAVQRITWNLSKGQRKCLHESEPYRHAFACPEPHLGNMFWY